LQARAHGLSSEWVAKLASECPKQQILMVKRVFSKAAAAAAAAAGEAGGEAAAAGELKQGDMLLSVDGLSVSVPADVEHIVQDILDQRLVAK